MPSDAMSPRKGPIHHLVRGKSLLRWEAIVFILVSVGDLLMTYTLLWRSLRIYESNPIAGWILDRWDIPGITAYKFGLVSFIILIGEVIERYRPRLGRWILVLGIVAGLYAITVGYRLLLEHG